MHYNKDIDAMCFASYNYNDGAFQGRLRRGAEAMQTLPTFCAGGGRENIPLVVVKWDGNILKLVFQYLY